MLAAFSMSTRSLLWQLPALAATILVGVACDPLRPGKEAEQSSHVSVAFDPSTLGDLAAAMKTLQIRIFKVAGDTASEQEGDDLKLAIAASKKEYLIPGVKLGLKEFEVSILNAESNALGVGRIRHLVKPGANITAPLVIKLTAIEQPLTDISVSLRFDAAAGTTELVQAVKLVWKTEGAGTTGETALEKAAAQSSISYASGVKDILDENCIDCHSVDYAAKTLELDAFPFKSTELPDATKLLAVLMARIENADEPMPPSGLMAADVVAKLKSWHAAGFPADDAAAAGPTFSGAIKQVKVADKLVATLVVTGADGVELYKKEILPYSIQPSGVLSLDAKLEVEDSQVSIPIVVERAD